MNLTGMLMDIKVLLCNTCFLLLQQKELELSEKMDELKAEHEEFVKEENKIKASKIEVDQELERYTGIIKENKAKMSHWKKQVRFATGVIDIIGKVRVNATELAALCTQQTVNAAPMLVTSLQKLHT